MAKGGPRRGTARVATSSRNPDAGADAGRDAAEPYFPACTNVIAGELDSFCVYAAHREVQPVKENPRLADDKLKYPLGNDSISPETLVRGKDRIGQAGWDLGLTFGCLEELADVLHGARIPQGKISRLAIATHGRYGGLWFPNGSGARYQKKYPPYMTKKWQRPGFPEFDDVIGVSRMEVDMVRSPATDFGNETTTTVKSYVFSVEDYHPLLHRIGLYVRHCGSIILMGCVIGQGPEGTAMLKELARVWPHRKIVGFSTFGMVDEEWMMQDHSFLAGMKDTGYREYGPLSTRYYEIRKRLYLLPWASEASANAKMVISHGKDGEGRELFEVMKCPTSEFIDRSCFEGSCPEEPVQPRPGASPEPVRSDEPTVKKAADKSVSKKEVTRRRKGATK